jgi:hypothetical protein
MPKVAIADTFRDWEGLLAAAERIADQEPGLPAHIAALRATFEALREVNELRRNLEGRRREAAQRFTALREEGLEKSLRLRALIRSTLGHRSEGLVEYGMKPRRSYRRRAAADGDPTSPA